MTAPLWVSQALNAHAATIKTEILPSMIPLLKAIACRDRGASAKYALFVPERWGIAIAPERPR